MGEIMAMSTRYHMNTRCDADGRNACYIVTFHGDTIATFPVVDPSTTDAREYAQRFTDMMNAHIEAFVARGL